MFTDKSRQPTKRLQYDKTQRWLDKWLKKFNPTKCKLMEMGHGERMPDRVYHLAEDKSKVSMCERDSWVNIESILSPKHHLKRIVKEMNYLLVG